jgi:hypothetical protein
MHWHIHLRGHHLTASEGELHSHVEGLIAALEGAGHTVTGVTAGPAAPEAVSEETPVNTTPAAAEPVSETEPTPQEAS